MKNTYIQSYNIPNLIRRYRQNIIERRLAIVEIDPEFKRYFVVGKPYQFDSFGLILITAGSCEITINLERTKVQKNDILVVLPQQFFEIITYSDDFAVQAFFVDGDLFLEAGFHLKSNNLINSFSVHHPEIFSLTPTIVKEINYHLKKINSLNFSSDNLFAKYLILHHFSILMYQLGNFFNYKKEKNQGKKEMRKEELAKQFLFLISSYFKQERSVQFYADKMFISRKHLTKVITEVFKKTPKELIIETIILEAKILLKNPKNSISTVTNDLNFQDIALFSKFFKNNTGISPRDFKRNS